MGRRKIEGISVEERKRKDRLNEKLRKKYAEMPEAEKNVLREKRREYASKRRKLKNEYNSKDKAERGVIESDANVSPNDEKSNTDSTLVTQADTLDGNARTGMERYSQRNVDMAIIESESNVITNNEKPNQASTSMTEMNTLHECASTSMETYSQMNARRHRQWYSKLSEVNKSKSRERKRLYMKSYKISRKGAEMDEVDRTVAACDAFSFWRNKIEALDIDRHRILFHGFEWSKTCPFCGVELLHCEDDRICCNHGKRTLKQLPPLPNNLEMLYDINNFSSLSRKVNPLFCFTALGVNGQFIGLAVPSSVAIMGRTYHQVFPTSKPNQPLHWYIHDSTERLDVAKQQSVPLPWVLQIGSILDEINPFSSSLRYMKSMHMETGFLTLNGFVDEHELAAIVHANNTVTINPRSAVLWLHHDNRPVYMNILDSLYEPLQYPLLFPHGTPGWGPYNAEHLSQIEWYRCRLMQESRFSKLGRLTNEYLVDMYSRVEDERLNFLATKGYKKAPLNVDIDYAEDEDEEASNNDNARLPASFLGSKRWCSTQMADALALARAKGHPSFFITMTTNPNWLEIQSKLFGGQNASVIPLIVVRCFHARLARLKSLLRTHFGEVVYMVHVIEFQKRGLPHAHIVVKVKPEVPIELIDSIISAELPTSPEILIKVKKYMIHRHSTRCWKDDKCCWGYPKPLSKETHVDDKGYVHYKRSNPNDANVVSYNPFLLSEMDCHINVDVSATVHIFMYLYMYIYKGFDKVEYRVNVPGERVSDIDDYINARYLSAMEAIWRIMAYHITSKEPSVKCLPVHLQDKRAYGYVNKLTASVLDRYFLRPSEPEFTELTYIEYNEKYSFRPYKNERQLADGEYLEIASPGICRNVIRHRQRGELVCRIRLVLPHNGEIFYLRQLLMHSTARNWGDLKTFNGQSFTSYQETALAMGLLEDSKEPFIVMDEAIASLHTPGQLRFLFALLLVDGAPAISMWESYRDALIADLLEKFNARRDIAEQTALTYIENILIQHGVRGLDVGLPTIAIHPDYALEELLKFPNVSEYALNADIAERDMNDDQLRAYTRIRAELNANDKCVPLFVDGKAGAGKTFLLKAICHLIRSNSDIILPCATTGLAALLCPGGRTAHSLFEIPVMDNNAGVHSLLDKNSDKAKLIHHARAIIWDEFPMANKAVIDAVNILLQEICNKPIPFGGKCFIAAGDFRQIAPVVKGSGKQATIDASIKSSATWNSFIVLKLETPIRNAGDTELVKLVNQIGEDTIHSVVELSLFKTTNSFDEAKEFLFPREILCLPSLCENRGFLTPLNIYVWEFNNSILRDLPGIQAKYFSYDRVTENEETISPEKLGGDEFLNNYKHPTLPPHALALKEGAICQLMKSLDREKGLVKNVRVIIEHVYKKFVTIRLLGATHDNNDNIYPISRMNFYHQPDNCAFTIHRRQLPLRLAYSTTFHSCLGLTLDKIVLDLRTPVFAHGQLYTALTRIRKREDVLILHNDLSPTVVTRNVVYQELLD